MGILGCVVLGWRSLQDTALEGHLWQTPQQSLQAMPWGPVHPGSGLFQNEADQPLCKGTTPWASFLPAQEGAGLCLALVRIARG